MQIQQDVQAQQEAPSMDEQMIDQQIQEVEQAQEIDPATEEPMPE